ncbi:MAG: non-ribosomal peptide synthetase, partial [Cyclobacteriaceae bacterium]
YGIGPDELVGIMQDRSEWLIISVLAVLKSGGAYVPIDPGYPDGRISFIKQDTACRVTLDSAELEQFISVQGNYPTQSVGQVATADHLAYVIYTSGSTGTPKGVMINNASLANYLSWSLSNYTENSSPLQFGLFTSLSFDLTVTSIFLPLISGGKLEVFSSTSDVTTTLKKYLESEISHVKLTPTHINLLNHLDLTKTDIQVSIVGGDRLDNTHIEKLRALNPAIRIYNEYGPTESTVGCAVNEVNSEKSTISIGNPIANTSIYILNDALKLQPIGVIGEICVSGNGLAQGYLSNEKLTAEKFVNNPFADGEKLYRTGDLGRWLSDGNIEFIGRTDDQVKIRGYRVETGEIESVLSKHDELEQVVVIAKKNDVAEHEIIAYFTAKEEVNSADLRTYLKSSLPDYMLPSFYIRLDEIPISINGKIAKNALPYPDEFGLSNKVEYVPPGNEIEEKLVNIWEDVLQREKIGIKDDFFDLGGHSLKALTTVLRVNKEFKIGMKITNLFNTTTIEELAVFVALALNKKDNFTNIKEIEL